MNNFEISLTRKKVSHINTLFKILTAEKMLALSVKCAGKDLSSEKEAVVLKKKRIFFNQN